MSELEVTPKKKVSKIKKLPAIVCDYDDTIVSFTGGICKLYNKRHNTAISDSDIKDWDFITVDTKDARGNIVKGADLMATFKEYESNGLYVGLRLLDKAKDALNLMYRLGYKIIIVTARDEKFGKDTELSLIFRDIAQYVDQVHFTTDKVKKIQELSKSYKICLFVDDKASTCQSVAENCKVDHVCLVEKAHNVSVEMTEDVKRVKDLFDTIRYLKDVN